MSRSLAAALAGAVILVEGDAERPLGECIAAVLLR